jgi:hypothetical protein
MMKKTNGKSQGDKGSKKNWLMYGGLALLAVYGVRKFPMLRTMVLPLIASAATRYFSNSGTQTATA